MVLVVDAQDAERFEEVRELLMVREGGLAPCCLYVEGRMLAEDDSRLSWGQHYGAVEQDKVYAGKLRGLQEV
jgi:hypothetical protein